MSWSCFSMFPSCSLDLGVQLGRYGSYDYAMTQPLLYPHALASSSPWVAACQASFPLRVYQQVAGRMSFKLPTLWGEDGHRVVNKNEHHWRGNMVGIQQFFLCGCLIFDDNWHRRGLAGRGVVDYRSWGISGGWTLHVNLHRKLNHWMFPVVPA